MTIAAVLLLAATLIAAPEQPVSVLRYGGVAESYRADPVSATNGETMLIVWHDRRGTQAVRFESDRRLDATSIAVPILAEGVFWNGEHWVIVNARQFVRIDANGNLLDRVPRPLGIDTSGANVYGVVWTGGAAIVVTGDTSRRERVAWTFDREMVLTARTLISPFGPYLIPVYLASNGSSALMVYQDEVTLELKGLLFDGAGTLLETKVVDRPATQVTSASIGTDGRRYAVVYGLGLYPPKTFTGFTLDTDLHRRTIASFDIPAPPGRETALARNLVFDGSAYTAYFGIRMNNHVDVVSARIAADGTILEPATPVFAYSIAHNLFNPPHAQIAGGTTALVYTEPGTPPYSQARVRINSRVEDLPAGPFSQSAPITASTATQSIVAWRETVAGAPSGSVFATRVDPRAVILDPEAIALGSAACPNAPIAAASDGRDFLVVWRETIRIAGSLVRADGTTKPLRIQTTDNGAPCSLAAVHAVSNGAVYLVVWHDRMADGDRKVFAVRVAADGKVLDREPLVFITETAGLVKVATDGRDFLITSGRHAYLIPASGPLVDTDGIRLGGYPLQVWWNGSTYVVAVQDEKLMGVRFRRIGSDGSGGEELDEVVPELHPWTQRVPLFNDGAFRCGAEGCVFPVESGGVIVMSRINDHGDRFTLTTDSIAAPAYPPGDGVPENINLADGFLAYSRYVLDEGNASRVFVRRLDSIGRSRAVRH